MNNFRYIKVGYYRKQKRKEIFDNDISDIKKNFFTLKIL